MGPTTSMSRSHPPSTRLRTTRSPSRSQSRPPDRLPKPRTSRRSTLTPTSSTTATTTTTPLPPAPLPAAPLPPATLPGAPLPLDPASHATLLPTKEEQAHTDGGDSNRTSQFGVDSPRIYATKSHRIHWMGVSEFNFLRLKTK